MGTSTYILSIPFKVLSIDLKYTHPTLHAEKNTRSADPQCSSTFYKVSISSASIVPTHQPNTLNPTLWNKPNTARFQQTKI